MFFSYEKLIALFLKSIILDAKHEKNCQKQPRLFFHLNLKVYAYCSLKVSVINEKKSGLFPMFFFSCSASMMLEIRPIHLKKIT